SHLLIKLALLHRAGWDPAGLLERQREILEPIVQAIEAQRAELEGFDTVMLAWRRATAAAALGFLDDVARPVTGSGPAPVTPKASAG
ncbi:MAG TPA: hypothetical protein VEG62_07110, partial [Acidimicrobiales bacterium]|nr:hypothetical protein [Acidimicrobiales bacterium]